MVDVGILVADLHEAVPKLVEFVVERCAADLLLCVVELDADVALLDDDGLREVLVVHEDAGDVGAIYFAAEGELTVYDVAGVEVGQVAVLRHLQIELLAVKVRHVGGTLYVVGAGTGGERQECGNSIDDLVHNMFDHLAEAVSATDPFRFRYRWFSCSSLRSSWPMRWVVYISSRAPISSATTQLLWKILT